MTFLKLMMKMAAAKGSAVSKWKWINSLLQSHRRENVFMCGAEQVVLVREDARLVLYTMTSLDFVLYLHNLHEWASMF